MDPVFVSKHGDALLRQEAVDALKKLIVPMAEVVTPNLLEASGLAGFEVAQRFYEIGSPGGLEETRAYLAARAAGRPAA